MIDTFSLVLRNHPEIAVFLAIGLGMLIGRLRIGNFVLGPVAGALLMGLVIGQVGVDVPHVLKSVFFVLFIYAIGFKSGPEFFGSLNRGTLKLVMLSLVLCGTAFGMILLVHHFWSFDAGFTAGLAAGALTDTAMLGTASSAISQLDVVADERSRLYSHMAVAYAITYLFGTIGLIEFVGTVAPRMLGINLRQSARELEQQLGIAQGDAALTIPYTRVVTRAHRVATDALADGKSIAELEQMQPSLCIERVVRQGKIIERDPALRLCVDDIVGIHALREAVGGAAFWIGPEVDDPDAMSFPVQSSEIVLTSPEFVGRSMQHAKTILLESQPMSIFVQQITRQEMVLPLLLETVLRRGDVITVTGRAAVVDALAKRVGRKRERSHKSDIAVHTLGIVAGSLLGLLSFHVGAVPLEFGIGGGVLLVALLIGWYNSRHPEFGALPPAAQWGFSEFGLTAFCAVVGLIAGPAAIDAMHQQGVALLLSGALVTLVPPLVALFFGRYVLRLHPMILLGGIAGAQTEPASISKLLEKSGSNTPVIGFTVCYGISSVVLAMLGPIVVAMAR